MRARHLDLESDSSDPLCALYGLPHILFASDQTIPNIIGLLELKAKGYILLYTGEQSPHRLRDICSAFGFKELMPPVEIDSIDKDRTETITSSLLGRLRAFSPSGWVWNFTPGTKLMLLGILKGLAVGDSERTCVRGSIYIDTRREGILSLLELPAKRSLGTRLTVMELLTAQGIHRMKSVREKTFDLVFSLPPRTTMISEPWPEYSHLMGAHISLVREEIGKERSRVGSLNAAQSFTLLKKLKVLPAQFKLAVNNPDFRADLTGFVNGKWLEVYLYSLLLEMKKKKLLDDLQWSITLYTWNKYQGAYQMHTDIDVCFSKNNNFRHISCKTEGREECKKEIFNSASRQRQLGGAFGKGILCHWFAQDVNIATHADLFGIGVIEGKDLADPEHMKKLLADLMR